MTPAEIQAVLSAAALTGWKAVVKPLDETTGHVAVVTSPDFNPVTQAGRLFAARDEEPGSALIAAIAKVQGSFQ